MLDFKQVDEARKILGLSEYATGEEIKDAFRHLALKYHPDNCPDKDKARCEEMFKKISNAKDIITMYCSAYKYSFKEKDVNRNAISKEEYEHLKRFFDGWWGDLDL